MIRLQARCLFEKPLEWRHADSRYRAAGIVRFENDPSTPKIVTLSLRDVTRLPELQSLLSRDRGTILRLDVVEEVSGDLAERVETLLREVVVTEFPWLRPGATAATEGVKPYLAAVEREVRVTSSIMAERLLVAVLGRAELQPMPLNIKRAVVWNASSRDESRAAYDDEYRAHSFWIRSPGWLRSGDEKGLREIADDVRRLLKDWLDPADRVVAVQFCGDEGLPALFTSVSRELGIVVIPVQYAERVSEGFYEAGLDVGYLEDYYLRLEERGY